MKHLVVFFTCLITLFGCFGLGSLPGDLEDELPKELAAYKLKYGHYPKCANSAELIQALILNGNYTYPEYFDYEYDGVTDHYILTIILHHEENNLIIDSREYERNNKNKN